MAFPTPLPFRPCCLFHSWQYSTQSQLKGHRSTARGTNGTLEGVWVSRAPEKCGPLMPMPMPASESPGELVKEEISSTPPRPTYLECLGAGPGIHILSPHPTHIHFPQVILLHTKVWEPVKGSVSSQIRDPGASWPWLEEIYLISQLFVVLKF